MLVIALLLLVVPIVEIYFIVQTSHAIGFGNTLGLLILIAVIGSWLVKHEGIKVWNRFAAQIDQGKVPSNEIADGVCLLVAGALMLTPGFLTDIIAVLLILPPTRVVLRNALVRRYTRRRDATGGAGRSSGRRATYDTTATDVTPPTVQLDP